jgi:hypothetical protein
MILLIVCFLLLIMLITKTKIEIAYLEHKFYLKFIFFGVIKIKLKAKTKKVKKVAKEKLDIKILFKLIYESLNILRLLLSKTELNVKLDCVFCIYSCDKTAIVYGVLNSMIYCLHTLLCSELKKYDGVYNLKPDLNNSSNDLDINFNMEGRIKIRNISIILIACRMLPKLFVYRKRLKNKRRKINESSNRRFNENYNG